MAAKHLSLLLLLTLLSSLHTHARDSQMFNKVPSKTNENVVKETQVPNKEEPPLNSKEQEEPNFIPENENSYGLYGHDESSGQLPPSTTTPNNEPFKSNSNNFPYNAKYLPKNYNPVAYVTEPEDFNESSFEDKSYTTTTTPNKNNNNGYYNGVNNYYNGQQQQGMKGSEFMDREYTTPTNRNNYYNNAGNNYDVQQESMSDTRFMDRAYTTPTNNNNNVNRFMDRTYTTPTNNMNNLNNHNYNTGGRVNRVQPQGMSDTRFLENGRYYYDINAEKYSRDPYENSKEFVSRNQYNPRGYYGNNENSYQYNNNYMEGQEQYHDEEDMP